ncbi:MAG: polyphosphate polymerase domain-containing protein [Bacteroidota bacterium]|nr:polyphosphate polymerase domain-containing protein [Bacteroidota bacterium]
MSPQLHQLLQSRSPLGLEAIDAVALMDRFDSKYVVPVAWLEELIQDLSEHSVLSIRNQVSTVYNNLYFDTPEGTCLEDHTRGKNMRYKVRVRQYANTRVAFLEVKLRDVHSKTFKHRIVRQGAWDAPLTQEELDFLGEHLPNANALVPALQSSFERFTLIHVGQGERITFDQDLQFKLPSTREGEEHPWVKPTPHLAVVEWKQSNVNHQGELIQAIRAQKGRRGPLGRTLRLSKFVLGQAHLAPERNFRGYRAALRDLARAEHYAANPTFAPQSILR